MNGFKCAKGFTGPECDHIDIRGFKNIGVTGVLSVTQASAFTKI